jgi:hypothetical protein
VIVADAAIRLSMACRAVAIMAATKLDPLS